MTDHNYTDDDPEAGEMWVLYSSSAGDDMETTRNSDFSIVRVEGETDDTPAHLPPAERVQKTADCTLLTGEILYDMTTETAAGQTAYRIPVDDLRYRLPSHDEWSEEYEALLDHLLGYLPPGEALEVIAGEHHQTIGECGKRGLRNWVLEGFHHSITEYSVGHGHGPSRYANSVESRLVDIPDFLVGPALESELNRWDGMLVEPSDETASKMVEIYLLMAEYDVRSDAMTQAEEIVNEYELEYDELRHDIL